ncbi:MAG TPA: hypothetical protein VM030_00805 [Acidimicrobiales bacterium]|nr:hypothetical protein [Acidimicrobiales bacterium]
MTLTAQPGTLDSPQTRTAADLEAFIAKVDAVVGRHPVVVDNGYTRWFATGQATRDEVRHLTVQFSVFSHLFVEAQLRKVINAATLEGYRAGKEILMNELGVIFKSGGPTAAQEGVDPELVSTEGTVDGGRFKFAAAHFEWLLRFATPLGLEFDQIGKRRNGTDPTLFFCDELLRLYGSDDASIGEGASYAVEHWAAAGFWKELIAGLTAFKERECPELPLAFWTWHDKVEDQHAAHTSEELAEAFFVPGFDEGKVLAAAAEMLDGVKAFWDGLEADRLAGRGPSGPLSGSVVA